MSKKNEEFVPRFAYIMRGVPGSGKSTVARKLAGEEGKVHSTDDFFMKDGVYTWEPKYLGMYHKLNLSEFGKSCKAQFPVVVCDNTNVRKAHFRKYADVARTFGYIVVEVKLPHPDPEVAAARNTHAVPQDAIERMIFTFQD
jgi:predicted kinase